MNKLKIIYLSILINVLCIIGQSLSSFPGKIDDSDCIETMEERCIRTKLSEAESISIYGDKKPPSEYTSKNYEEESYPKYLRAPPTNDVKSCFDIALTDWRYVFNGVKKVPVTFTTLYNHYYNSEDDVRDKIDLHEKIHRRQYIKMFRSWEDENIKFDKEKWDFGGGIGKYAENSYWEREAFYEERLTLNCSQWEELGGGDEGGSSGSDTTSDTTGDTGGHHGGGGIGGTSGDEEELSDMEMEFLFLWYFDFYFFHPDDSFSVSSGFPPQVEYYRATPDATLFFQGASNLMSKLLAAVKKSVVYTGIKTNLPSLVEKNRVLIIPSGGLVGLDNSQIFKDNLAEFVNQGGVLVCFSQPNGYEFSALPGGLVGGYGWGEDQECHSNAVYINTYHPVLSGQGSGSINMSVDGYFTTVPDSTIVLLSRTKNNQPAMILYPYGQGYVIATTMYEDWAFGNGQSTTQGQALVRDIISWAKDPKILQEIKAGESVDLSFEVKNKTDDKEAIQVKINVLDPNRNIISESTQPVSLLPGQNSSLSTVHNLLSTSPLGIWSVEYSLSDSAGIEFQKESSGERFAVSNPPESTVPSPELSFSLQMDAEVYASGTQAIITTNI